MLDPVLNFAKATLMAGYAAGVTTIVASSGEGAKFPDPATDGDFNLVWWNASEYPDPADDPYREIVRVTARTSDTFTVVRAQEGTSDNDHNIVDRIYKIALPFTKKEHDEIAIQYAVETITANYTAGSFGNILADASGGTITVSLPNASGVAGRIYTIKKIAGNASQNIVIDPAGAETIDGSLTVTIRNLYDAVKIVSDGTNNWFII